MTSDYRYPDENDKLLADHFTGIGYCMGYWAESEKLALERCFACAFAPFDSAAKSADIGCGEGRLLGLLAERSAEVIGVEPSRERFEISAKVAEGLPHVTVLNDTADALPTESFDVVLCSHVIQHVCPAEQQKLVANIRRILKPQGIVILTTTFQGGKHSKYVAEYWQDGERVCDKIDAAGFDEAYRKDGVLPVQRFSRTDVINYFPEYKMLDFAAYHFLGMKTAGRDALLNRLGLLATAKDAYYILQKVQ